MFLFVYGCALFNNTMIVNVLLIFSIFCFQFCQSVEFELAKVGDCANGNPCSSLQQIQSTARPGGAADEIKVDAGVTLTYDNIGESGKSSASDPSAVLINANFKFTVTNTGNAVFSGGVSKTRLFVVKDSHLEFNNFNFTFSGRAFLAQNSTITFNNCNFISNTVPTSGEANSGGAFWGITASSATFKSCHFEDNRAVSGGAIAMTSFDSLVVEDCTFRTNGAVSSGGAIVAIASAQPISIKRSTFAENFANDASNKNGLGGAVLLKTGAVGGTALFDTLVFEKNEAAIGGALFIDDASTARLTQTSFLGNIAEEGGAVRTRDTGRLMCVSCTVRDNVAATGAAMALIGANSGPIVEHTLTGTITSNKCQAADALEQFGVILLAGRTTMSLSSTKVTDNSCQGILIASDKHSKLQLTKTNISNSSAPPGVFVADVWALEGAVLVQDSASSLQHVAVTNGGTFEFAKQSDIELERVVLDGGQITAGADFDTKELIIDVDPKSGAVTTDTSTLGPTAARVRVTEKLQIGTRAVASQLTRTIQLEGQPLTPDGLLEMLNVVDKNGAPVTPAPPGNPGTTNNGPTPSGGTPRPPTDGDTPSPASSSGASAPGVSAPEPFSLTSGSGLIILIAVGAVLVCLCLTACLVLIVRRGGGGGGGGGGSAPSHNASSGSSNINNTHMVTPPEQTSWQQSHTEPLSLGYQTVPSQPDGYDSANRLGGYDDSLSGYNSIPGHAQYSDIRHDTMGSSTADQYNVLPVDTLDAPVDFDNNYQNLPVPGDQVPFGGVGSGFQ